MSWQTPSHQWLGRDGGFHQLSLLPGNSHHPPLNVTTPSVPLLPHCGKASTTPAKKWPFILIPRALLLSLSVHSCSAPRGDVSVQAFLAHTPDFLALMKNAALSCLSNAPVTVCISRHDPSRKHMTEMVLYWLQLFDRKKRKDTNRLWMSINTVWELWIIRDIRFPADVFVL